MTRRRAIGAGVAVLMLGLGACDDPAADLIVTAVPPSLHVAETGILQISIAARAAIETASLTIQPSRGLDAFPPSFTLSGLVPAGAAPSPAAGSPPNPPALGVVPVRNFTLKATEAGTQRVTVTLSFDGRSVSRTVDLAVRGD